jgi:hypothetical protein
MAVYAESAQKGSSGPLTWHRGAHSLTDSAPGDGRRRRFLGGNARRARDIERVRAGAAALPSVPHRWRAAGGAHASHLGVRDKEKTMEPLRMMETATGLFVLAALGGLVMAGIRFAGKDHPPTWLAMLHGLLAAAGLTLLIYAAATVGVPSLALYAIVLFVIAAAGGLLLNLGYHWKGLPLPKGLMVGHAVIAVVGFLLLLVATFAATPA